MSNKITTPPAKKLRRSDIIKAKWLPNGNLRFYRDDARKGGCAELQCNSMYGVADTLITAHPLNVIIWYD